jgi:hypothetical protein
VKRNIPAWRVFKGVCKSSRLRSCSDPTCIQFPCRQINRLRILILFDTTELRFDVACSNHRYRKARLALKSSVDLCTMHFRCDCELHPQPPQRGRLTAIPLRSAADPAEEAAFAPLVLPTVSAVPGAECACTVLAELSGESACSNAFSVDSMLPEPAQDVSDQPLKE